MQSVPSQQPSPGCCPSRWGRRGCSDRHLGWLLALCILILLEGSTALRAGVILSEVHYHPPGPEAGDLEFIELLNDGDADAELGGWSFVEGVEYRIPDGTRLQAGETLLIASDRRRLLAVFTLDEDRVLGNWTGSLSNRGERLTLVDAEGAWVDGMRFDDVAPWPTSSDGDGSSLQRVCALGSGLDIANWQLTEPALPTPLVTIVQSPCALASSRERPVLISEIFYHPPPEFGATDSDTEFVEVTCVADAPVDMSYWSFRGLTHVFESGTMLEPGESIVVANSADRLREAFDFTGPVAEFDGVLEDSGERVSLLDERGLVIDSVRYGDSDPWPTRADGFGGSLARRHVDGLDSSPAAWDLAGPGSGIKTYTATGTVPGTIVQRLRLGIDGRGEFIVDEVSLRALDEPDVELLEASRFEVPGAWTAQGIASPSIVEEGLAVDGGPALRLRSTGACVESCLECSVRDSVTLDLRGLDPRRTYRLSVRARHVQAATRLFCGFVNGVGFCLGESLPIASPGLSELSILAETPPWVVHRGRSPIEPRSDDPVWISAFVLGGVTSDDGPLRVELEWSAGERRGRVLLEDDGLHRDGLAGDAVFGGRLPPQPHDTAVIYRLLVTRGEGPTMVSPRESDLDAPLSAAAAWGYYVQDNESDDDLATVWLQLDGVDAEDPLAINTRLDCQTFETACFAMGGELWPMVDLRFRGQTACFLDKRNLAVRFPRGRQWRGRRRLNLQALWTDKSLLREKLAWELTERVGLPAASTEYVRVFLNGRFHGLFLALEHPDEEFLVADGFSRHDCLYKAQRSAREEPVVAVDRLQSLEDYRRAWQEATCEDGNLDSLIEFVEALHEDGLAAEGPTRAFFEVRTEPRALIAYQLLQVALNNLDQFSKNHFLLETAAQNSWQLLPWDLDLVLGKFSEPRLNSPDPLVVGTTNDCMLSPGADVNPWLGTGVRGNRVRNALTDFYFRASDGWFQRAYLVELLQLLDEVYSAERIGARVEVLHDQMRRAAAEDQARWGRTPVTCLEECLHCVREIDLDANAAVVLEQVELHRQFLRAYIERFHSTVLEADRLLVTEIHANAEGPIEETEFVELLNVSGREIDIGGWSLGGAVQFVFPSPARVPADAVIVVVRDRASFLERHGERIDDALVWGNYLGRLDEDGGVVEVFDSGPGYPARIDRVRYRHTAPWPRMVDGISAELLGASRGRDNGDGANWAASATSGGTPGRLAEEVAAGVFLRGDVRSDGRHHVGDVVELLLFLFRGGRVPGCLDAADVDDDGAVDVEDALRLVRFLFSGGAPPAPPWPSRAADPSDDGLDCQRSA